MTIVEWDIDGYTNTSLELISNGNCQFYIGTKLLAYNFENLTDSVKDKWKTAVHSIVFCRIFPLNAQVNTNFPTRPCTSIPLFI